MSTSHNDIREIPPFKSVDPARRRNTPLHAAAVNNHMALVELLVLHGADVELKNLYG